MAEPWSPKRSLAEGLTSLSKAQNTNPDSHSSERIVDRTGNSAGGGGATRRRTDSARVQEPVALVTRILALGRDDVLGSCVSGVRGSALHIQGGAGQIADCGCRVPGRVRHPKRQVSLPVEKIMIIVSAFRRPRRDLLAQLPGLHDCVLRLSASRGRSCAHQRVWLPTVPLIHCLTHTSCKLIVLDCERAKRLQPSTGKLGGASLLVLNSHEDKGRRWKGMRCWDEVMAAYDKDTSGILKPDFVDIHPEDNATIMFTSVRGTCHLDASTLLTIRNQTTGLPKGVLSTQRQFGTNILNAIVARRRAALRRGEEIPVPAPGTPQPGLLISVPLFHVTLTSHMMMATFGGAKAVLIRKWVPEEAARVIIDEKLTSAGGVPSMPGDLLETILAKQHYPIEGLSLGGAPAPESLPARARKAFPSVTLSQGYGMTECNAIATSFAGEDYLARPTSCGLPPPVNEISIVAKGRAVPAGEVGEVWIRGPNVMKEYWRDTKATSKVLTKDGWLRTGDLGLLDQEGFLYIKDRIKDIIIRGGENIDSTSVENALFTEGVQEAAAVAVPDIKLGELVAAVVSVSPEFREKITEAGLIALARERLPKFAVPVMVLFLDALPHNASGKVVKADLRALAGKEWERRRKFAAKL
ncbi:unnamed protein product [Mycena citricolor]|uniref:Uncharacterized protein n=1 Tax=Mycena citricolor TaxID=2018698 RepID=A0AAD2Q1Y2_9AGAR|nr:unnamed protein product [Mycena citricolor]